MKTLTRIHLPVSILYKSIAGRYRPVSYPDGPITARYRFIKNLAGSPVSGQRMDWLIRAFTIRMCSDCTFSYGVVCFALSLAYNRHVLSLKLAPKKQQKTTTKTITPIPESNSSGQACHVRLVRIFTVRSKQTPRSCCLGG